MPDTRQPCPTMLGWFVRLLVRLVPVTLVAAGCGGREERAAHELAAGPFEEIASPAGLGGTVPHLAAGPDGGLAMSWIEPRAGGGHRLLWSVLSDGGWSAPARIAEGDSFFVNWADFPSFLSTGDAIYAHWLWKNGRGTYAYEVRVSVSKDGGATWLPPAVVHDDGTATEHGFVSMVAETGSARLVWLDGRAGEGLEEEDPRRSMHLRTALVGPDLAIREAALLDERVCDCCATDVVETPRGPLVAYRDRSSDEVRDVSLVRLAGNSWAAPQPAWKDGWRIAGCPVNGPALDSRRESVALAWYTAAGDTARVYCSLSGDGGASFGVPVRLDEGHPLGRVDVLCFDDGSALASWLEARGDHAEILVRRVQDGSAGPSARVATTSPARKSGFPRMARAAESVFVAWTDVSDSSRVRVARAALAEFERAAQWSRTGP